MDSTRLRPGAGVSNAMLRLARRAPWLCALVLAAAVIAGCPSDPCPAPRLTYMGMCVSRCPTGSALCRADGGVIPGTDDAAVDAVDAVGRDAGDASEPGDAFDASDLGPPIACDGGVVSMGRCIFPLTDPMNCGSFGHVCPAGSGGRAACVAGACTLECLGGFEAVSGGCDVRVPRPIAPMSTSNITSRRPVFKWESAAFVDGALIEICRTRACAAADIVQTIAATGTQGAATADLTRGVWFWRVRGRVGAIVGTRSSVVWQFTSNERTAPIVTAWGSTLDVNGDGLADVAVGAPRGSGDFVAGRVHLFMGAIGGPALTPTRSLESPAGASGFGASVASAGDVNGDGFGDLIVGAVNPAAADRGDAYVYLGGAAGAAGLPIAIPGGDGVDGEFGLVVAAAGDVNGDGYGDVIVAAPDADGGTGRVHLFSGSADGVFMTPMTFTGTNVGGHFGTSVAGVGDFNGDGFPEIAIGEYPAESNGRVWLYFGTAGGIPSAPAGFLGPPDTLGNFARSMAGVGDVNGDGFTDFVVGSAGLASPPSDGSAHLYLGNGPGLLSSRVTIVAVDPQNGFGASVHSAGDINGDGYSDVVIGASRFTFGTTPGRAYAYLGTAAGLTTPPATLLGPAPMETSYGWSVTGGGDTGGDRFADIVVGAQFRSAQCSMFIGGAAGASLTPVILTAPGAVGALTGYSVASIGPRAVGRGSAQFVAECYEDPMRASGI